VSSDITMDMLSLLGRDSTHGKRQQVLGDCALSSTASTSKQPESGIPVSWGWQPVLGCEICVSHLSWIMPVIHNIFALIELSTRI